MNRLADKFMSIGGSAITLIRAVWGFGRKLLCLN